MTRRLTKEEVFPSMFKERIEACDLSGRYIDKLVRF